ncbi:aspartyl protease family A01A [Achlya hypogyna]|uniref:Aspartyl protease family A01A n=1 Tax=Achlya hypogyna TaxID=1202772 RepID=A0A1V9ZJQ7_ACHHY|nr:aspartyl protease family A01A [Achlya hypogyna]
MATVLAADKAVFVIQREALRKDEAIRKRLQEAGFRIMEQTLLHLTEDKAATYYEKLNCRDDPTLRKNTHRGTARGSTTPRASEAGSPRSVKSPREKSPGDAATPRGKTPRHPGDAAPEAESPQDAIRALSSGPIVAFVLTKANALKDLTDLVGPSDAAQWPAAPTTLRAQFGTDQHCIGVRCSKYAFNVDDERDFLFANAVSRRDNALPADGPGEALGAMVSLDALMDFLFPPQVQHSNSTGRLFVFSLYGPLDAKSRLRSGERGQHVVTDLELNTMSQSIEREDILSVYGMVGLSRDEEEEVLRQADKHLKTIPRYTRRDVDEIFRHVPRDGRGDIAFHHMQKRIMEERLRRIVCMKEKLSTSLAAPIVSKYRRSLASWAKDTQDHVAPPSMFIKDAGLNGSENAVLISRLLNCHAFQICHLDEGNSSDLTQNVRLLRQEIASERTPWDSNHACVKRE